MVSSCSLGSMPSRTESKDSSSASGSSDTTYSESSDDSDLSSESTGMDDVDQSLQEAGDQYMAVLSTGDIQAVMEYFQISFREIIEPMYDCYEQVFYTLFKNVEYSYGPIVTSDHIDYELSLTCKVPDIASCVNDVLEDEEFMKSVSSSWVQAMIAEYNSMDALSAYADMLNNILVEALRRINGGEFTDKLSLSDYFRFHDNDGRRTWLCTRNPSFVTMCGKNHYMRRLVYIAPVKKLDLISLVGNDLVEEGTIKKNTLDTFLIEHTQEILES